jgi:hypothetical protein
MASKKSKKMPRSRGGASAPKAAKKNGAAAAPKKKAAAGTSGAAKSKRTAAKKKVSAKKSAGRAPARTQAKKTGRSAPAPAKKGARKKAAVAERAVKLGAAPKKAAKKAARPTASRAPTVVGKARPTFRRRDGAGHIDRRYAAGLLAHSGESDRDDRPQSFVDRHRSKDSLAENFGEEFVQSATSGENQEEELLEKEVPEERGGPFVETTSGTEFAEGTDASNPKGAKREPFPTT